MENNQNIIIEKRIEAAEDRAQGIGKVLYNIPNAKDMLEGEIVFVANASIKRIYVKLRGSLRYTDLV